MNPDARSRSAAAFRDLRRALARRRLRTTGARLGAVTIGIAVIVSAFAYWQVRVPLDGLRRNHGEGAALIALAGVLGALALAGAVLAGTRATALQRRRPGPEWLALPVPPPLVGAHLGAEARLAALAVVPPASAALLAGLGLLPAAWLLALAAAFALAWRFAAGAGVATARAVVRPSRAAERALPRAAAWLAAEPRRRTATRRPAAAWRRSSAAAALTRLDLLATFRGGAARARLATAAAFGLAGLAVWFDGAEPVLRRAQAFVFFMPVAASLGAWAAHRACAEPADLHRPLPIGLGAAWRARALPLASAVVAVVALNALLAQGLPDLARVALVPRWAFSGGAVALLGLHYGLTLVPRADAAEAIYAAWLGAAVAASLMIPLLGWPVLLAGLIHSSMRLGRWREPEWAR